MVAFEPQQGSIIKTPALLRRLLFASGLVLLAACGDSTAPGGAGQAISVAVVPSTASLLTSGSQDFTATVTNDPSNGGVTWSITACSGDASVCGSLGNMTSTRATYTAPTTAPPALGVTATAVKDNSKSFTATVAITAIAPAGQIAFTSNRDGQNEIYVMNADGSGAGRLTNNPANDFSPAWSLDAAKIAFVSDRDGHPEIYVINADGSGLARLTNNPAQDEWPAWSPDGSRIAFITTRDGNPEIYAVNADGSGSTRITSNPWQYFTPVWSPDGTKIAFSGYDGSSQIYVVNADGSNVTRLTSIGSASSPVWSPDGSKIAFASNGDGNGEVYLMNADGSGVRNLTN